MTYRPLTAFKAYDIRGRLGLDLDEDVAFRVGRAFAAVLTAKRVVLGRDCRASSQALAGAVARGLMAEGVEVAGAALDHGLLHIDLRRTVPDSVVQIIKISRK